ncbi:Probable E3 ubiquitin-protein ligase HERC1 (HECT domain and RCC1-like domain-containing protein 1) (HECT-type E3 ubiquitin transferase HERC1) (p532) (p619) [Durusdinium trenchii]|uniref:Probable E3 ubiquitin-protein ligase HERC1 (HECT domain and RCC1-like domain-containing protein 1) (HECT-type E3 ubiquitin transferase HERC1) (p532) (p619) n=1 Tax=Durusdinium trenchii TaxID=1381693 RepID=A0ABP0RFE3_9DINO
MTCSVAIADSDVPPTSCARVGSSSMGRRPAPGRRGWPLLLAPLLVLQGCDMVGQIESTVEAATTGAGMQAASSASSAPSGVPSAASNAPEASVSKTSLRLSEQGIPLSVGSWFGGPRLVVEVAPAGSGGWLPKQRLVLDSGSSTLAFCDSQFSQQAQYQSSDFISCNLYNPGGDFTGYWGPFVKGAVKVGNFTIPKAAYSIMQQEKSMPCTDGLDGIFGIAFRQLDRAFRASDEYEMELSPEGKFTCPNQPAGVVPPPLVQHLRSTESAKIGLYWSGQQGEAQGRLYLGQSAVENEHYALADPLPAAHLGELGWYDISVQSITVGEQELEGLNCDPVHGETCILDTGTPAIVLPPEAYELVESSSGSLSFQLAEVFHDCIALRADAMEEVLELRMFQVFIPSGESISIYMKPMEKSETLQAEVQRILRQCVLLATLNGDLLEAQQPLNLYGFSEGGFLTAVVQAHELTATHFAFAFWHYGCDVHIWGLEKYGGEWTELLRKQLKQVVEVKATSYAFAALCGHGPGRRVVTWGDSKQGGDSTKVQAQLEGVKQIQASGYAFAALREDGRVVTWGNEKFGGKSTDVQHQLTQVQQIYATSGAFAAVVPGGRVVTWGDESMGGNSQEVQKDLWNVRRIYASAAAFAALRGDGRVVTWGGTNFGADSSRVQDQLRDVQHICGTHAAFAAILSSGRVVTWGQAYSGGDSSDVQVLRNVQQISASSGAFAAVLADGRVVTWGNPKEGGDSSSVQGDLKQISRIEATHEAFAAIRRDGRVVTWGDKIFGGDSSHVQDQLRRVQVVLGCAVSFAAVRLDGEVITWGDPKACKDYGWSRWRHG